LEIPDAKRRRTLPPVLDGKLRGWAIPNEAGPNPDCEGYEDEEYLDEEKEDFQYLATSPHDDSPYKSANNLLHELHTLHKHRLLFEPQSSRPQEQAMDSTHASQHYPGTFSEPRPTAFPDQYYLNKDASQDRPRAGSMQEESQCVRSRYEDTNKWVECLAWFHSRV